VGVERHHLGEVDGDFFGIGEVGGGGVLQGFELRVGPARRLQMAVCEARQ